MEFLELIKKRYSVRSYKKDDVPSAVLDKVLEAARLAPTAANRQSFQVFVVKTDKFKEELKKIYPQSWFVQAPYVIGICGIPKDCWIRRDGKNYIDVDVAIVMDHIILAATDLGLGTCWIGAFDPLAAQEFLNLSRDMEPVVFTPLGYPADNPAPKRRKPLEEIVRFIN